MLLLFAAACGYGSSGTPSTSAINPTASPATATAGGDIAYVGSNGGLWLMNANGSNAHEIYLSSSGYPYGPEWSPNGNEISFTEFAYGAGSSFTYAEATSIVIVDTLGRVVSSAQHGFMPHWSPDGSRLSFLANLDVEDVHFVGTPSLLDVASGSITALSSKVSTADSPRWSPDGDMLAYYDEVTGVYVVEASGGGSPRRLATGNSDSYFGALEWVDDHTVAVFDKHVGDAHYLFIELDAGLVSHVSNEKAFGCGREWSPRDAQPVRVPVSKLIAWSTQCVDPTGIWIADSTGKSAPTFIEITSRYGNGVVDASTDGRRLLWSQPSTVGALPRPSATPTSVFSGSVWVIDIASKSATQVSDAGLDAAWRP